MDGGSVVSTAIEISATGSEAENDVPGPISKDEISEVEDPVTCPRNIKVALQS
jgi:hypothetical protein